MRGAEGRFEGSETVVRTGIDKWSTWLREGEMGAGMSGDGYSPVNSGGVFSISAGRTWQ